jgi:phage tail sheath gpL-like
MSNDLTGITGNYRTPGHYAEILYAQGPASAAAGERHVVFVMPKTSAGTWTANTLYGPIANEKEALDGGGAGSMIHRGIRKFMTLNKDARVYAVPYAASSGGSPAAATLILTIATTATASGVLNVWACGELCQAAITTGDTPTVVGDAIVASINGKTHLPITAANSTGTVTLTAKIVGASQGNGTVGRIRCYTTITSGIGTTSVFTNGNELGDDTAGADGTTTEPANFATALAVLDNVRKYYIVTSLNDATSLGSLKTHIVNKSAPKRGLRSVGISAYTHTLAAGQTIATTLNYERISVPLAPVFQSSTEEIAAAIAAKRQEKEGVDIGHNFNGEKLDGIIGPYSVADWLAPGDNDVEDALLDGLTPLYTSDSGVRICQSVSTRSKDATGALDDSRASRTVKISVTDGYVDTWLVRAGLRYGQKKFKDDDRLANGKVNSNQKQIKNVVRPSMLRSLHTEILDEFDANGLIQNIEESKASLSIAKSAVAGGRAEMGLQLHVIDWFDQSTLLVSEVSPN